MNIEIEAGGRFTAPQAGGYRVTLESDFTDAELDETGVEKVLGFQGPDGSILELDDGQHSDGEIVWDVPAGFLSEGIWAMNFRIKAGDPLVDHELPEPCTVEVRGKYSIHPEGC